MERLKSRLLNCWVNCPVQQTCSETRMSQRRIRNRQTELPTLPYWRSILASFVLVLSMILLFEIVADPRSGELRTPAVMAPVFALFVIVDAGVFYAEFRLRKRRPPAAVRAGQKVRMNGEGACVD